MEFKDFEYTCAIAKYQSITRAAEALFITQPTLSTYIKNMEKRLGIQIFDRDGNRVNLTYEGELFVEGGLHLLNSRNDLIDKLHDSIDSERGRLKLAIPIFRGSYLIPLILPVFHQKYPNIQVILKEGNSHELEQSVRDGDSDLVIFNKPCYPIPLEYEVLNEEEMLLVMHKDNPVACMGTAVKGCRYPRLDLTLCADQPFIVHQPSQHTGQIERQLFKEAGIKPHIVLETKNLEVSYRLASDDYGLSFISEYHIEHNSHVKDVVCFSVGSPLARMTLIAGYMNKNRLSKASREFIQISKNIFSHTT